jgi:membrane protein YqaA with SNARE-associated domain
VSWGADYRALTVGDSFTTTWRTVTEAIASGEGKAGRRHLVRRLYDWTISWADHPAGAWALFAIAVAESSFFPVPPDVLLIALCVGASRRSFKFALIASVGSVLGGVLGYAIGYWGYDLIGEPIVKAYHGEAVMAKIKGWYDEYGFWGNLAAALTPIPYKVFTIASGMFQFSFGAFLAASVIGRSLRFFVVGGLIYVVGPQVKTFIEKYFDWLAIGGMALLIGGFVALKYLR